MRWRHQILLCLVSAAACTSADTLLSVTRTDSADVEIVVNQGGDRLLGWTFTPRLTLGGAASGPESFYALSPQYVATDGTGRLYVLDRSNVRLVAFDAQGSHLWSAGSQGQGPGEFESPTAVTATAAGLVSVVDASGMKIEHFDSAGAYLGGERIHEPPWMSRFDRSGEALVVGARPALVSQGQRARLLLVAATDTTRLVEVALDPARRLEFEDCPIRIVMTPVFAQTIEWASSHSIVAAWTGPEYAIGIYEEGRLDRSYRRDIEPTAATPNLAAAEYPEGMVLGAGDVRCEIPAAEAVEKRGYGAYVPLIRGLAVEPNGTVRVQRTRAEDHRADFDVLGPDGAYVGTVRDAPVPVAFMPDGSVVGIETDELDIDRIVVYEVGR